MYKSSPTVVLVDYDSEWPRRFANLRADGAGGRPDVPPIIDRLATLGYRHLGNPDVEDREAFDHPGGLPRHHLYVCPEGSIGIVNQLAVRDYLRAHPDVARR